MTDRLEQRLLELGTRLQQPETPDLTPGVLARLPERRMRGARTVRRTLALAFAVVLLAASVALAVPATRHAILRVLGLRGVSIERVEHLPPLPAGAGGLGLGKRIPVARARHAASFTALLPPNATAAYLNRDVAGGRVSVLSGPALIIEFRGTAMPFIFKLLGPGTQVNRVHVNGGPGVYIYGAPHEVFFQESTGQIRTDRIRLAGNVLIWQQGRLTLRVEGARTLQQALVLARSLR
ncbi:MAG: hypothetical protein QOG59_2550 [Solirubrobacteraceae bacterium]|jgi:hypothetical protein|nr:hypothetical protein [Solirubrobacteraceae bacterium]